LNWSFIACFVCLGGHPLHHAESGGLPGAVQECGRVGLFICMAPSFQEISGQFKGIVSRQLYVILYINITSK